MDRVTKKSKGRETAQPGQRIPAPEGQNSNSRKQALDTAIKQDRLARIDEAMTLYRPRITFA